MALPGLRQLVGLGFERAHRLARVTVEHALALHVAVELLDPRAQRPDRAARAFFLIEQPVALGLLPVQHGVGDGRLLAQRRQRGFAGRARLDRLGRAPVGAGRGLRHLAQLFLGGAAHRLRRVPAQPQEQPLGPAQRLADLAVARRRAGLPRQRRELRGLLFDHVIDAGQVLLGAAQLQLRLVAPLVKPGNARRLFEDAPPRGRLGVDQLGDLALPHQRGRLRAGRGVGEKHLHVAGPDILAVEPVGRTEIAGDAAHDLQRIGIVEGRGRQPLGIVDRQRHLGVVARGTGRGTGEDHVLHAAAAHRGGAIFAHHPAQRLQKVRLAAAIGAHHAGEPVLDHQIGRVHEALEAVQPQPGESHESRPHSRSCPRAYARRGGLESTRAALGTRASAAFGRAAGRDRARGLRA
ncbi:hypothetical protein Lokhon_00910 [Limimaricola hongkongensis DSM 17492]|uniref:Uncharacterized protein n=1 Tax=Limimaricola hongkongensis DSM 17492 TaxID=1122180 RepID=A0A017HGD4_9RHOB|nr:hypothetical protein Lokhon_00910 [Limimaricola hongkongensis DSM 17492]